MSGRPVDPAVEQQALRWLAWAKDDLATAHAIARNRSLCWSVAFSSVCDRLYAGQTCFSPMGGG
jgi:hypothetical protein